MKKLLTILLVLLVAGFVFAGEGDGTATLTLKQSLDQKTTHGFFASELSTFGAVFDDNKDGVVEVGREVDVKMDIAPEGQGTVYDLGYYSFATNSPSGIKIDLTGTAMTLDADNVTYVPYEISFNKLHGGSYDNKILGFGMSTEGYSLGSATNVEIVDATVNLINDTSAGGTKWATFSLTYEFDYSNNAEYGLPAGDYTATVTAAITSN